MSTDLTTVPSAAELEKQDAELAQAALANIDRSAVSVPMIVLTQQLTKEVENREIESGRWLNKVTGEDLGDEISLVIGYYYVGRFYSPKDQDQTYNAQGPVAPANWPSEFAGKHFADIPQAEEQHKAAANDPDNPAEWGSGPEIETTHNFIGFLPEYPDVPVRVSLKSTSAPTAQKVNDIATFASSYWLNTFDLGIVKKTNKRDQPYFVATARKGEQTTPEQRAAAREVSFLAAKAQLKYTGEEEATKSAPKAKVEKPSSAADVV